MAYKILYFLIASLTKLVIHVEVSGKDNIPRHGPVIIASNHVNLLDSPILLVSLGRRVHLMAKEELFHPRLIGWLATQLGAFPVAKGKLDRRAGKTSLGLLDQGEALAIFPEGMRSSDGRLGPAYQGAVLLSTRSNSALIPVGITGTSQLVGKKWLFRRPKIGINIGRPFTLAASSDKPSKEEVARLIYQVMRHIAAQLPPEYHGRYAEERK
jgi:1-acyl-sn-glycerol-3-phosphate acyltransferase